MFLHTFQRTALALEANSYDLTKVLLATITLIVGVITLTRAVDEYLRQNSLRRYEKYVQITESYEADPELTELGRILSSDSTRLAEYNESVKYKFMSFFEDVAMLTQSRLMRMEVAAYLLGYHALLVQQFKKDFTANLWKGDQDPNWALFWSFLEELQRYSAPYYSKDDGKLLPSNKKWPVKKFRF